MIFSLGEISKEISFPINSSLDIFFFFKVPQAITCPPALWFEAICTSLKMKHAVLLLEDSCENFPVWDSQKRWQIDDNWCWLSPRALGVIKKKSANPKSFQEFKNFLKTSK
jgi:hypothetical protein